LKDAELIKVQVITRHGDRTPLVTLDNFDEKWECDDARSLSFTKRGGAQSSALTENYYEIPRSYPFNVLWKGSCDAGQLTAKGSRQHYELGKTLREIYVDRLGFLPKVVQTPEEGRQAVYVRSTDYKRTQDSARFLLSGLYPASTTLTKTPAFRLATRPTLMDSLNPSTLKDNWKCPRLNQLLDEIAKTPEMSSFYSSTEEFRKRVRDAINPSALFNREPSMVDFMEVFMTRICNKIELPCFSKDCVVSKDVDKVQELVAQEFELRLRGLKISKSINQLEMGLFLKELTESLTKTRPAFELYSGHDTSLSGILALLDAEDLRCPPYASNLIVELWRMKSSTRKLIRFIYNGNVLKTKWMDFKNGCDLQVYQEYVNRLIPKDFAKACKK